VSNARAPLARAAAAVASSAPRATLTRRGAIARSAATQLPSAHSRSLLKRARRARVVGRAPPDLLLQRAPERMTRWRRASCTTRSCTLRPCWQ
jgi:hypothetical protein